MQLSRGVATPSTMTSAKILTSLIVLVEHKNLGLTV